MTVHSDSIYEDVERKFLNWRLIDSFEDSDETTALDYDTGTIPVYDEYLLAIQVEEFSGGGQKGNLRVNGDSSANYARTDGDGTASTGLTSFEYCVRVPADGLAIARMWIKGTNVSNPVASYPVILAYSTTADGAIWMQEGRLHVSYSEVDRIGFFMDAESTGRVEVYGRNYS